MGRCPPRRGLSYKCAANETHPDRPQGNPDCQIGIPEMVGTPRR
jgi:hypothetical protein